MCQLSEAREKDLNDHNYRPASDSPLFSYHLHAHSETRDLENKLELEREKRELLEREVDMLRLQLHQTNETLLHYKALLSVNNLQVSRTMHSLPKLTKR